MSPSDPVPGEQPAVQATPPTTRHGEHRAEKSERLGGTLEPEEEGVPEEGTHAKRAARKPRQPADANAASPDGGAVKGAPDGDKAPTQQQSDTPDVDGHLQPPPYTAATQSKRASIGQKPELADSTGEIAETEAQDLASNGVNGWVDEYRQRYAAAWNFDALSKPEGNGSALPDGGVKKRTVARPGETRDTGYPPLTDTAGEAAAARERDRAHAYRAGGIRFAPWNIPYRRRLQTLAVLAHCLCMATTISLFFFLCAIPLMWPILIPYLLHLLLSKSATDGRLRMRSERFRRLGVWNYFADYFPAKLHKTHELPPTRKYIFGYHPHGIISHGAFAAFATEALGFSDKFPGITNSLLTLDSNFRIPLYRDYILATGMQSVSKESITNVLTRGGPNGEGMGRAVTIVVGGARESLEAEPGVMRLVLGERKGFVKMAMRTGADLVPVLAFGENELYDQTHHPSLHKLQMWVLRTLKFTLPFLHGRGIFNYDVGLMPYRRPLNIVVGRPILVAQAREGEVDPKEVDRLHREYVAELQKMWDCYKDVFVPERVEELRILK